MAKTESKPKKVSNKLSVTSKLKQKFSCPLCNKIFSENMTYIQLNQHLNTCGKIHIQPSRNATTRRRFELSFDDNINKKLQNKNNYYPRRRKHSSVILKEISKNKILNYSLFMSKSNENNNSENDNKEEKREKSIKGTFDERYNQMVEYFNLKKNQYKKNQIIKGDNINQILIKLKYCNIYDELFFISKENDNDNKFNITDLIHQYFDLMIKIKKLEIINGKTIAISLGNKIDFELFGYILAILLIYPECKINYKLPHLICKLILNEKVTLNDIQYENKALYEYLIKLKNENDFSLLNIHFNYDGKDLIANGSKVKVDEYNIEEYIDRIIDYEILKYKKEINIISGTLFNYVPKNYILNFRGEELYQIFNRLF